MARILLVEDDHRNRDMISRRLRHSGYEVLTAVDGEQAIAMANSESPMLILMDMSLPSIDGWEATRRLKTAAATRDIPIIALTANVGSVARDQALAAGCDDYAEKPIVFNVLLGKMADLLAAGRRP